MTLKDEGNFLKVIEHFASFVILLGIKVGGKTIVGGNYVNYCC